MKEAGIAGIPPMPSQALIQEPKAANSLKFGCGCRPRWGICGMLFRFLWAGVNGFPLLISPCNGQILGCLFRKCTTTPMYLLPALSLRFNISTVGRICAFR